jgi:predicted acyl esterase
VQRLALVLIAPATAEPRFIFPNRYSVRTEINVRVPMRDGVKLATDLTSRCQREAALD